MPSFMVDTNVLLDFVAPDRGNHMKAAALFRMSSRHPERMTLYALASSLKDVYFIYERHYGNEAQARNVVRLLAKQLVLCDCDTELVQLALDCDEPDFEDGLVLCAARRARLDGIVTRDKAGFVSGHPQKLSLEEALALVGE